MKTQDTVEFSTLRQIIGLTNDIPRLISYLENWQLPEKQGKRGTWFYYRNKMVQWLKNGGRPPFSVLAKDNSKIPFWCFSALPFVTCPGMGACAKFCYSTKAWRYPASFFRQLQNTILLREQPNVIAAAFHRLPIGSDFRLYVDGDFGDMATMSFWFTLLAERPDVRCYGYSKSWLLFLAYNRVNSFPLNYKLNLSSGSRYSPAIKAEMEKLSIVRGDFIAVNGASVKLAKDRSNWAQHAKSVRERALELGLGRVFVCPGKCGNCTSRGHACGLDNFKGIPIAIAVH